MLALIRQDLAAAAGPQSTQASLSPEPRGVRRPRSTDEAQEPSLSLDADEAASSSASAKAARTQESVILIGPAMTANLTISQTNSTWIVKCQLVDLVRAADPEKTPLCTEMLEPNDARNKGVAGAPCHIRLPAGTVPDDEVEVLFRWVSKGPPEEGSKKMNVFPWNGKPVPASLIPKSLIYPFFNALNWFAFTAHLAHVVDWLQWNSCVCEEVMELAEQYPNPTHFRVAAWHYTASDHSHACKKPTCTPPDRMLRQLAPHFLEFMRRERIARNGSLRIDSITPEWRR